MGTRKKIQAINWKSVWLLKIANAVGAFEERETDSS
jgi:hypothetical protein